MARFDDRQRVHTADLAQQPDISRVVRRRVAVLHRQRDAGHGHRVADDRAHRVGHPHGAGADGGVPADVPAVAARRCAGRRHRSAPPAGGGAADAGRAGHAAHRAAAGRHRRPDRAAVLHLRDRLLHGAAVAGLEHDGRRQRATRRAAAGDHHGGDRLQRRARARSHAGRCRVRVRRQRLGVRHRGGHHAADVAVDPALAARSRIRRHACRPNGCGAARWRLCASRATPS